MHSSNSQEEALQLRKLTSYGDLKLPIYSLYVDRELKEHVFLHCTYTTQQRTIYVYIQCSVYMVKFKIFASCGNRL